MCFVCAACDLLARDWSWLFGSPWILHGFSGHLWSWYFATISPSLVNLRCFVSHLLYCIDAVSGYYPVLSATHVVATSPSSPRCLVSMPVRLVMTATPVALDLPFMALVPQHNTHLLRQNFYSSCILATLWGFTD
jgi:hypothetical protein